MAEMDLKVNLDLAVTKSADKRLSGYDQLLYTRIAQIANASKTNAANQGLDNELLKELYLLSANWEATTNYVKELVDEKILLDEEGKLTVDLSTYWNATETKAYVDQKIGDNIQADWNETTSSSPNFIKNKPTNVSEFTNDAGYLTKHQDLTSYATKDFVTEELAKIDTSGSGIDLSAYATYDDLAITLLPTEAVIQDVFNLPNGLYYAGKSIPFTTGTFLCGDNALTGLFEVIPGEDANSKTILYLSKCEYGTLDKNGNITTPKLSMVTYTKDEIDTLLSDVHVDLTGYATEEFVNNAVASHEPDLTSYVSKKELEEKKYLTEHQNLDNYATHDYVMEQITNVATGGTVDLTGYASKEYVDQKIGEIDLSGLSIPTKLSELENDTNFITANDIAGLDLSGVNISTFEGSMVDLASAEDGFYYVPGVLSFSNAADFNEDVEVTQTEIHGLIHKVSYENKIRENYPNLSDEQWEATWNALVQDWTQNNSKYLLLSAVITNYDLNTESYVDYNGKLRSQTMLADSYTREQIDKILTEYATPGWVEGQGYLTEHQSLEGLAHEEFVLEQIKTLAKDAIFAVGETAEDNITIEQAIQALQNAGYITEAEVLAKGYLTADDMPGFGYLTSANLENYASKTYVAEQIAQASLGGGEEGGGIDLSSYATKEYVDKLGHITEIKTAQTINDFLLLDDGLYDIDNVKNVILEIHYQDKDYNVYGPVYLTHTTNTAEFWDLRSGDRFIYENNSGVYTLQSVSGTDTSVIKYINGLGYLTSIPEEYVTETELTAKNYATEEFVIQTVGTGGGGADLTGYATQDFVESKILEVEQKIPVVPQGVSAFENDAGYLKSDALSGLATQGWVTGEIDTAIANAKLGAGSGSSETPSTPIDMSKYATKEYVDAAVQPIPTNVSAFINDRNYATTTEVQAMIDATGVGSGGVEFETVNIDFSNFTF